MQIKTEWDYSHLLKSEDEEEIEKARGKVKTQIDSFIVKWKNNPRYQEEPSILKEALDDYEKIKAGTASGDDGAGTAEAYYFWLKTQIDQNDSQLKARYNKATDFANKCANDLRFFTLNISKIPFSEQKKFLENNELKKYKHFLARLFAEAKHVLSENEEKIMNLKAKAAHENWTKMVSGFLAKEEREILMEGGKKELKNFSEISSLIRNTNKKVRDEAAKALNEILAKNCEVAEAEINSIFENKKVNDELRIFTRPDASRHLSDDIKSEIVDSLVSAVSEKFEIANKYYELKAKLFGLKKLEYHERNIPYGKIEKKYPYEESIDLIYKVFLALDKEFADIFQGFVKEGRIDVFPKKGKRSGAFCSDNLLFQPTYIMLNHTDELNDVLTIAHEIGHGINSEMMKKKQSALTFGTVLSTAEVASTFMEDFVLEELMKGADEELKLSLMIAKLNDDVNTIIRQVACYNFEKELHSAFRIKGYLPKEEIGKIFQKNMRAYMGESIEQSPGSENWWVSWWHIRSFFYVYSYASGLLISKAMQKKVKENPAFIEKVKEFLSAGTSDSPENIFKNLGIDINQKEFWLHGLSEVEYLLNETEQLAKKLGKI